MDYFSLTFNKEDIIAYGVFSDVYQIKNENRMVVKKINHIPYKLSHYLNRTNPVQKEIDTNYELGMDDIAPRIHYYNIKKKYFVMEKMDYTLYYMREKNMIKIKHIEKIIVLITKLNSTLYRHGDLHYNNIMWSETLDDFRIIDWGIYSKNTNLKQGGRMLNNLQYYVRKKYKQNEKWYDVYRELLDINLYPIENLNDTKSYYSKINTFLLDKFPSSQLLRG